MSDLYRMTCSNQEHKESFTALVITQDNDMIEGIVRENEHTTFCIKGVYSNDLEKIAFLKASCLDGNTAPVAFVFKKAQEGYCSQHDLFYGFNEWSGGWNIKIEKLENEELLKSRVKTRFIHKVINLEGISNSLVCKAQTLKEFL